MERRCQKWLEIDGPNKSNIDLNGTILLRKPRLYQSCSAEEEEQEQVEEQEQEQEEQEEEQEEQEEERRQREY
jgi:hypothetical protein